MTVRALNITIQNKQLHQSRFYRELFIALGELNIAVRYQGDRRLLLSPVWQDETDDQRMLGMLDRFTDISAFEWYNREARREVTAQERSEINVPPQYRANYHWYYVLFDLRKHRLVFTSYEASESLSAKQVAYFFERLLSNAAIIDRFGDVTVAIEQEPAALERILDAPNLRFLSIVVNRPNASFGSIDDDFEDQMNAVQAEQFKLEVTSDERGSLKPDETIRKAAKVALSNGAVEGRVYEEGLTQSISTEDFPISETISYAPAQESQQHAFRRAAAKIIGRLAKALGNK